jgi:hypothetical protein
MCILRFFSDYLMKKTVFLIIIAFSFENAALNAQSWFSLGLQGGIYGSLPQDFDKSAIARYVFNGNTVVEDKRYHIFTYEQYGYFINEKDEFAVSPVAAITIGYESKRFAFLTGAELIYNINENFALFDTKGKCITVAGYTYSVINVPLNINLYFISKPKFKMGVSLGAFISFPLGDVLKSLPALGGATPVDIFNLNPPQPQRYHKSYDEYLKNYINAGIRGGLTFEFPVGRHGAVSLDIQYLRALTSGTSSMMIGEYITGDNAVEDTERKITIMGGPRITVGYKFKFELKGSSGADGGGASLETNRYFIVVDEQTEGPLSLAEMRSLIEKKVISSETMLWKKGLTNWVKASTFTELNDFFEAAE